MLSRDLDRALEVGYIKKCEPTMGQLSVVTVVKLNVFVMEVQAVCFTQSNIFKHLQAKHECHPTVSSFFLFSSLHRTPAAFLGPYLKLPQQHHIIRQVKCKCKPGRHRRGWEHQSFYYFGHLCLL